MRDKFNRVDKRTILSLLFIMAAALLVRCYGINFPLYHWDENIGFTNVFSASYLHLRLLTYDHGSFYPYLILILWDIYLLFTGTIPSTYNLIYEFFINAQPFLLLARGFIVIVSTATIWIVFLLARQLYNRKVGLFAAFFLAFTFLHAAESHYARSHVLAGFFILLASLFCARIMENGKLRDYVLAGTNIGLATAAQYSAILGIVTLFIAHILNLWKTKEQNWKSILFDRNLILGLDISALTFFLVTPYALIDFRQYASQIKWFLTKVITTLWISPEGKPVWLFYLTEHLRNGMGTPLALLAIIGIIYALIRHKKQDVLLVIFPLLLYVSLWKGENFARYLLPILPFLTIFAGRLLDELITLLNQKFPTRGVNAIIGLVVLGLISQSLLNIIRFDFWLTQPDTRSIAAKWFIANIPMGNQVIVEGVDTLGPTLPLNRLEQNQELEELPPNSLGYVYTKALRDAQPHTPGYRAISVFSLDEVRESGQFVGNVESASSYFDNGVEYLVTSSWMQRDTSDTYSQTFQESLERYYEQIAIFEPSIQFRFDPYAWRVDYQALEKIIPFQSGIGGPRLIVYKRECNDR